MDQGAGGGAAWCTSLGPHSKDDPQGSDYPPEIFIIGQILGKLSRLEAARGRCIIALDDLAGRRQLGFLRHAALNGKIRTPCTFCGASIFGFRSVQGSDSGRCWGKGPERGKHCGALS